MLKGLKYLVVLACFIVNFLEINAVIIRKNLTYDKYTLDSQYKYKQGMRIFQWDTIIKKLKYIDSFIEEQQQLGALKNYKNINGLPPIAVKMKNKDTDEYGIRRNQGIPLYHKSNLKTPQRYAPDGTMIEIISKIGKNYEVFIEHLEEKWLVPTRYVSPLKIKNFENVKIAVVDRKFQNITVLKRKLEHWEVQSMNPATTGANQPPYMQETPLGIFVVQGKREKMLYVKDTKEIEKEIEGFAPYATRFSAGGYIHGIPVDIPSVKEGEELNLKGKKLIEHSSTLGTYPRSHMCVRNATSHAKFIYDSFSMNKDLVIVIE